MKALVSLSEGYMLLLQLPAQLAHVNLSEGCSSGGLGVWGGFCVLVLVKRDI